MNTIVLFIVTVLVNALWQPALIAGIAWLALKLSRCNNATTRHAVWSLALTGSFIVPFISALSIVMPQGHSVSIVTVQQSAHSANAQAPVAREAAALQGTSKPAAPSRPPLAVSRPSFRVQPTVALIAVAAWLVVALGVLVRLLVSFIYLERLKHEALPLGVESRHALIRYDRAHKGDRDVRICVSGEITVPIAVGIFDAMILLPSGLVDELDHNDLDRVLLHELAHVRRSDDWINLFERIVQAVFFFSPGIYWISRQMDLEREVACDDWVLEKSSENVPYARCLAHIVEVTQWPYRAPAAPGVFVTRKSMSIRIERLLARGRDIRVRLALIPSLLALVFIVAVVVAGGFVSPTIAYTLDRNASSVGKVLRPRAHAAARHYSDPIQAQYVASPIPEIAATLVPKAAPKVALQTSTSEPVATTAQVVADTGYLDDLAAAGYKNLSPVDVIALKSIGVDGAYIRALQNAGLKNLTVHDLEALKSLGVDGSYVSEMRSAGLSNLDAFDLEALKSLDVEASYVSQMRAAGLADLDPRQLAGLKSLGVDSTYITELANAGYPHLNARDYEALKSLGIDAAYIRTLRSHGFNSLTVRQLENFKSLGVEPQ